MIYSLLLDLQSKIEVLPQVEVLGNLIINVRSIYDLAKVSNRLCLIDSPTAVDLALSCLDKGALFVIINDLSLLDKLKQSVPLDRIIVSFEYNDNEAEIIALATPIAKQVRGYFLTSKQSLTFNASPKEEFMQQLLLNFIRKMDELFHDDNIRKYALFYFPKQPLNIEDIRILEGFGQVVVDNDLLNVEALMDIVPSLVKTDRADGLVTTVVSDELGTALGLVYSSKESIRESVRTMQGVYQSRSRGLWYKGLTSGAIQHLKKVDLDCDRDTLRFTVYQVDPGFCHLQTRGCFGLSGGLSHLEATIKKRAENPPPESYTHRLLTNPTFLASKIMEESDELCRAKTPEEVAFEAADLLYFVMVKMRVHKVEMKDVVKVLDEKSRRITRRPGNSKAKWDQVVSQQVAAEKPTEEVIDFTASYRVKVYEKAVLSAEETKKLLQRPVIKSKEILSIVEPIVTQVREKGDAAVVELTEKFDKVKLSTTTLEAPFDPMLMAVDDDVKKAIDLAHDNLLKFHQVQLQSPVSVETMPGVTCSRFSRPLESVGLYVPGGSAVLPSTALHLGVPAQCAGVPNITVACPPRNDGSIAPSVVYAAHKIGAQRIIMAGGAQAIAAMAYGTQLIPKVDKICGPGNQFVTAAKMLVQTDSSCPTAIDMPAGPSEVMVIVDTTFNANFVASDLLSQAEHGPDSQVVLVAIDVSDAHLEDLQSELEIQAQKLPRRDIVAKSLPKSYCLRVSTVDEAFHFSNDYAPEHLILHLSDAELDTALEKVQHAGSVFIGQWTPESCGDYASGTNHTLPTYGYAKMYSGVNTDTFLKHITAQKITKEGLCGGLGQAVATLASVEELHAHRNAVLIRMDS